MSFYTDVIVPLLPLATIGVAFLGWAVLIRNTRRIASRSETYTVVQSLLSVLDKIESEAREYWLKNAESWTKEKSASYVAQIADSIEFVRLLSEVARDRSVVFDVVGSLGQVRQSLTLDAERLSTLDRDQRTAKVSSASADIRDLRRHCYRAFMTMYPVEIKPPPRP